MHALASPGITELSQGYFNKRPHDWMSLHSELVWGWLLNAGSWREEGRKKKSKSLVSRHSSHNYSKQQTLCVDATVGLPSLLKEGLYFHFYEVLKSSRGGEANSKTPQWGLGKECFHWLSFTSKVKTLISTGAWKLSYSELSLSLVMPVLRKAVWWL